ncbi:hypothetical protein N7474_010005 [Penicillium riverlandense]|uniref:uncharacterized protein n=1 Tax=Penicillium riverlandense TaxID=1903569 RepID=UPI0025498E80|nr:uncharacterized protein N7474_010005 [Penicillium riverlandense]KAJ5808736.1 hypothetical protein N7474_010005 [Penicillium riverlandense]
MGVTGLWTVVQPCARPVKLETLNKKRLAVDASIWIYQFLKAVRDKEGNALRNSHIVGFFRRICKLLYFGIRPVFVFDGGAPVLKRQTIAARKKRREGRREDAARTAGKLLAVQMQRSAEEEAETRRRNKKRPEDQEEVPDAPVYAEETFMTEKEKQQNRRFKKKDAYHLPNLDVSLEEMGAPNDPRIMSQEELEEYARQFHQGQDINLYDFSKIDFDSPFFLSLPATDRYNILNAARLRSRLRMGYSKEQLDTMFPDRMAFSKFQIDRVKERNDLTQRLMNINGMNGEEAFYNSGQRIAGERGREYVLVKDSAMEGGWVLGVVGNKDEGQEDKPIDLDRHDQAEPLSEDAESEDEFEDVPIEGLNRLPKLPFLREGVFDQSLQRAREDSGVQEAIDRSRHDLRRASTHEDDSLFVQGGDFGSEMNRDAGIFEDEEDEDLQKALTLSLQHDEEQNDEDMPDIAINRPKEPIFPPEPTKDIALESDDDMDFAVAMAQSKVSQKERPKNAFSGPLPFESIKLNKTRRDQPAENDKEAGGFVRESKKPSKKKEGPLPPWFVGERDDTQFIVDSTDVHERDQERQMAPDHLFLSNRRSPDIIDVDNLPEMKEVVDLEADSKKQVSEMEKLETAIEVDDAVKEVPDSISHKSIDMEPTAIEVPKQPVAVEQTLDEPHPQVVSLGVEQSQYPELKEELTATPAEIAGDAAPAQEWPSQPQRSLSPEFEDVLPSTTGPEITVSTVGYSAPTAPPLEDTGRPEVLAEGEDEYSDPEDEELLQQLAAEGEEHVRFAKTLNSAAPNQDAFDYEQELKQLRNQQKKDLRDADDVTQIMINECQQLLGLFGLPYITAPMEAEAQCAELVSLGLVDGIVTDDSDVFLFGGTRVYKNMFNQSKFVECYLTSDLEKEYSLHREKLISFAHLLGSDYTEGIPGIGPVTALEIVTEFSSLEEFRDWWMQVQMGMNNPDDSHAAFRKKFRKKASKIFLPPAFPNPLVDTAYLEPEVDADPSQFQWGVPDLTGLRNFLMTTIGWSQERTDEILLPVIRDMNRRQQEGTQSNITHFMQGSLGAGAFAPRVHRSGPSRMEKAFSRLQQQAQDPTNEGSEKRGQKRKART